MRFKFCAFPSWKNLAVVFIALIVLIVLIGTRFLYEAMPYSLFNATQILSIPISENPAVVFIVLIVLIVTGFLKDSKSFSLFDATQILCIERRIKVEKISLLNPRFKP